jgi:osmoprotectant transport system substrate-binding protein
VLLEDDRGDQPVYAPVPTVREAIVRAHPQVAGIVRPLMQRLDAPTLQALNARVQVDGESPEDVAADYLHGSGLLAAAVRP